MIEVSDAGVSQPNDMEGTRTSSFRSRMDRYRNVYLPNLIAANERRGFVSIHQLSQGFDFVGEHQELIDHLVDALESNGVRVTRSVADSRATQGIDRSRVEAIFASLLLRPPSSADVLRYLRLNRLPVSDDTIAYVVQAFELHTLSRQEEALLVACLISEPDNRGAFELLVNDNLINVCSIAKGYLGRGLEIDDLIQEGNIALLDGIHRYQPEKAPRMINYVGTWIRQRMGRACHDQANLIRLPVHAWDDLTRLQRARDECDASQFCEPTIGQIARAADVLPEQAMTILRPSEPPVWLGSSTSGTGAYGMDSILCQFPEVGSRDDEDLVMQAMARHSIQDAIGRLSDREAIIIRLRFGLSGDTPLTLEAVGESLGLTRERIRQIEAEALRKLQHPAITRGSGTTTTSRLL